MRGWEQNNVYKFARICEKKVLIGIVKYQYIQNNTRILC